MQETRRRVLEALADGPASGPAIASDLGISRAAVWKHVEALRAGGFEITSGEAGYRLESTPEFGGLAVSFGLDAPFEVEYHESIDSTNRRARELAGEGAEDVVVLADAQTGGRGRLDRTWESPPGGVWLSLLLRPDLPPAQVPVYTLAAAVATARAAQETGLDACIKWPNDVLVVTDDTERKLAGILTEMEGEADRVSWVIVGIGVNANIDVDDLPPGATSLREEVGAIDRRAFVQRLLMMFHELRDDPDAILSAWREHAHTLGRRVRIETPTTSVIGEAIDVEPPGVLVVETAEGLVRVSAGDCEHLRPVDG